MGLSATPRPGPPSEYSSLGGPLFYVQSVYTSMIMFCPHCGHSLNQVVVHGITSCTNCNRVFDTNPFNRLLSASWLVRRKHIVVEEALMHYGYTREESELVIECVVDNCFTHEDFVKFLKEKGISQSYSKIDLAS